MRWALPSSLIFHFLLVALCWLWLPRTLWRLPEQQKGQGAGRGLGEVIVWKLEQSSSPNKSTLHSLKTLKKVQTSNLSRTTNTPSRGSKKTTSSPEGQAGSVHSQDSAMGSSHLATLRSQIQDHLDYPLELRRKGVIGTVKIHLTLSSTGELISATIAEPSPHSALDQLALEAIHKAAPFQIQELNPAEIKMGRLKINLPIEFKLES